MLAMMLRSLSVTQHTHSNCSYYRILAAWGYHRQGYCQAGFAAAATKVCDLREDCAGQYKTFLIICLLYKSSSRDHFEKYFTKQSHFTGSWPATDGIKSKCL